jgi:hypothetical protein
VPTLGKNQPFECFKANPFSALPLKSALPRSDEIFGLRRYRRLNRDYERQAKTGKTGSILR